MVCKLFTIADEDLYQFTVLDSRNEILICFIDADELKSLDRSNVKTHLFKCRLSQMGMNTIFRG